LLRGYGQVVVHGSYALDLMIWRDLDLYVHPRSVQISLPEFFQLGATIAGLLPVHRMHFRDERKIRSEGLPTGLYWGIYLADGPLGAWKIDLWAVDHDELERLMGYQRGLAARLTEESRKAIVEIKAAVHRHSEYRHAFGATDVYDAVLESGVRDVPSFASFILRKCGVDIDV